MKKKVKSSVGEQPTGTRKKRTTAIPVVKKLKK